MWRAMLPLVLLMFAPLGLSLDCWKDVNTTKWVLDVVCTDETAEQPQRCDWDVVYRESGNRVSTSRKIPPIANSDYFYCSGIFELPLQIGGIIYRIFIRGKWKDVFNFTINNPGQLKLKNCPQKIKEGNNVTCECSTQHEGNPAPIISWTGQTTSPILQIHDIRREDSKNYTCEMLWGKQKKTISYSLQVGSKLPVSHSLSTRKILTSTSKRGVTSPITTSDVDDKERKKDDALSSLLQIIAIVAPVVLVMTIVTVIAIVVIRRKRKGGARKNFNINERDVAAHSDLSQTRGDDSNEPIENRCYVTLDFASNDDLMMTRDDFAEVTESAKHGKETMQPDIYAAVDTSKRRQAAQVDVYAIVQKNKKGQQVQPELYTSVLKPKEKLQANEDNFNSRFDKDFASSSNMYAVVDRGAKPKSNIESAFGEEVYAQVIKSPK